MQGLLTRQRASLHGTIERPGAQPRCLIDSICECTHFRVHSATRSRGSPMRAFIVSKYGQPMHEAEVPEPVLGSSDVLVRVDAAGLNQLDEKIRRGGFRQILPYRLPVTLG